MPAPRAVFLVALALLLVLGFAAVDAAFQEGGAYNSVVNESWTTDPGNFTTLDNSNLDQALYYDNETVFNSSGVEMTDGVDYEWNRTTGEIKAIQGGDLDPAQSANITYNFTTFTEEQQAFLDVFEGFGNILGVLLFVLGVAVVIGGLRFLGGGI